MTPKQILIMDSGHQKAACIEQFQIEHLHHHERIYIASDVAINVVVAPSLPARWQKTPFTFLPLPYFPVWNPLQARATCWHLQWRKMLYTKFCNENEMDKCVNACRIYTLNESAINEQWIYRSADICGIVVTHCYRQLLQIRITREQIGTSQINTTR